MRLFAIVGPRELERETSIVCCHMTLFVHCMTAQMTTALYAHDLAGRNKLPKDPWMLLLCFKAKLKMYKYQGFAQIELGKKEKIINNLFFLQCFVWFRVRNEKFQLAQQ